LVLRRRQVPSVPVAGSSLTGWLSVAADALLVAADMLGSDGIRWSDLAGRPELLGGMMTCLFFSSAMDDPPLPFLIGLATPFFLGLLQARRLVGVNVSDPGVVVRDRVAYRARLLLDRLDLPRRCITRAAGDRGEYDSDDQRRQANGDNCARVERGVAVIGRIWRVVSPLGLWGVVARRIVPAPPQALAAAGVGP
jgi:hypothetical protein